LQEWKVGEYWLVRWRMRWDGMAGAVLRFVANGWMRKELGLDWMW
jgi:hypothetical protein